MIQRELKVLVLGEVPEVGDIFERPVFTETYPTSVERVPDPDQFGAALEQDDGYNLVLLELAPHGIEVLDEVRGHWPALPVLVIADPDEMEMLLEAEQRGLEDYVVRLADHEVVTELLAEKIESQWRRFVEPPSMERPGAGEVYRYAQFHNVLQPFVLVSEARRLLYVNKAARTLIENLHDYSPAVGDPIGEWWLDDSPEVFQERLARAFAGHQVVARRNFTGDIDDSHLHELYYQPVVDPSGRVVAVSIAVHEAARPELQRARTRQALSEFAGGVAHQNNNLVNILTANIELLQERCDRYRDEEVSRYLARMRRAAERAAEFTHQLQTYSMTAVIEPRELSFNALLRTCRDQLAAMVGEEIELTFDLEEGLPRIRGDRKQLKTMITLLVENAADAIDGEGRIEVHTRGSRVPYRDPSSPVEEGRYVLLEVTDTGEGIPEEVRDRVFEPFFSARRGTEHVGLGLAIIKTIVEQSGGGITYETSPEQGTTFRVYFPVEANSTDQTGDNPDRKEDPPSTVLLVEDEDDLRASFRELFELEGYQVMEASTIERAYNLYAEGNDDGLATDLVVTDVELPDGRASELVDELGDEAASIPFVFVSGYGGTVREEFEQRSNLQCVFLTKPLQIDTLLNAVRNFLRPG